jgi:Brp/Blh family beta-carotene 15,15'-monooxygenase
VKRSASTLGWGALAGAAVVASFGTLPVQIGFAVLAIGVVGMVHGASDLAIVERSRRPLFLALYAAVMVACLLWWTMFPAVALPLFLIASAIHFGLEDAPVDAPVERMLRGVGLVAIPAVFHRADLRDLLNLASGYSTMSDGMADIMAGAGAIAAIGALTIAARRSDLRLATGTTSLLLLPPLIGFSVGFLVLHAIPQTLVRQQQIGCDGMASYLRQVAPLLAGAILVVGIIGLMVLHQETSGVRSLFAAVAALAAPHLLITPLFERMPSGSAFLQPFRSCRYSTDQVGTVMGRGVQFHSCAGSTSVVAETVVPIALARFSQVATSPANGAQHA